jgi:S-adenosylmethionine decarboxylase
LDCKHCVLELHRGNSDKLNDEAFVREALIEAAEVAGATLLEVRTHAFSPQGITGFALLAESHISIHTWPECEFAAVDAFTCGETTDPEKACNYLAKCFDSVGYHISFIERTSPKLLSNHPVEVL